ncbi:MAG TPA: hypothetical protein VEF72_02180, partial [Mycobacterium sp.]|nr:hypothetical protein [Mycobacterium sp.]
MATCARQFAGEGIRADDRGARTRAAESRSACGVAEQRDPAGGPTGHLYAADRIEVDVYWMGHLIGGRPSNRDRAAEFTARGTIEGLARKVSELRRKLQQ